MEKLKYLVHWGDNKETAWSGTNYSLYKALQKYYQVDDVDLKFPKLLSVFMRRFLRYDWFTRSFYELQYFRRKHKNVKGKVLQMAGIADGSADTQSYLYIDLSVSYLEHMKENLPDVFAVSGFQGAKTSAIHKRVLMQSDFYGKCTGIFCMGQWLRNYLVSSGLPESKVIHVGGVNIDYRLINPQPKKNNKILFVGKDFKRKGGHVTYEAFKLLREQGHDVELYVVGPSTNPIPNPVEGYHYMGQVNFAGVAELFNKCDIFCLPSYFEAYGLVFIEALTFGLPCIGRDCYEMPYFIENGTTGLLLKNDDTHELAGLMERLLKDGAFKQNVAARHEHYLQEYSWDAVARRMKDVMG